MGKKRRFGRAAWLLLLTHLLFSPLLHADTPQSGPEVEGVIAEPAPLTVINRTVLVFRATLLGETPKVRAQRAKKVIEETLQETNDLEVRVDPILHSYLVLLGGRRAFIVTPLDAAADSITAGEAAEQAAENLRLVVEETRQARSLRFLLTAIGYSAAATLVFFMLVKAAGYCRRKLLGLLPKLMGKHSERLKVGHTQLFDLQNLYYLIDRSLWLLYWLVVLLFCYQWLGFVLSQFPYTRSWGESLNIHLMELLNYLVSGILRAMPGLVVALSIFFIARGISAFSKRVLRRMARPGTLKWLTAETLQPTMRLTSLAIWLFALVMAYPYLPGSGTDAFKGLSVLLGLMISLGATSVIGQGAAGLILTYTRTMRVGEFVRVGDYEGTVTEVGIFTTTIRTGLGEVLTLPNSMITGSVTKNYSRIVEGPGYVVDTVVTIGYDTPWRQVEAMLLEAARRTEGVLQTPAPQVFQTALSDFYPEYRLVAQAIPSEPRPRAQLLSLLHANIQDVFNEYGVQIMSPHYLGDPEQPKWVPKEQWHAVPSKPENTA
ncbi:MULTISPECIES: mechanosensitive ion channel family protein [Pseudomonas]|jgi:small-conductance mechanosensitive channel|uniref:Small-conductance mechanosensitive channel n=1 Tax=Pseudomonas monteilii TaxID=76759 RepID=A0A2N1ILV4_9PSED|nr:MULTISPECIES: mechanosensitive ion channel family protein [Pseudomonas]EKT4454250.1 mechanosensitive ion channel family protein [Pseudomonas putida]EKT4493232.1 mechanosensitive ion channel family protein [Pseudomonas putida]EKT4511065.1 mechanosensitive ion channel family protein [Pseudomonas putida]EKT4527770.1 mechanosensitive ion channel family protein [Pseudomonas putida]EKT8863843.1 mechanosensitive ion channel family protein [Pseudomonas putida]